MVVPEAIPVATPDAEPIVAIAVLLLLQMPPETASVKVPEAPAHTEEAPDMVAGDESRVIEGLSAIITVQPVIASVTVT